MGKTAVIPPGLTEPELLNFGYLRAVYSLNMFYGYQIKPAGRFETKNEKISAEVIGRGGDIREIYKSGADAGYCALLSDPLAGRDVLLKTVELFIPF
ncbi:MAG: hypothetical protein LBH57_10080 [Treponema sp.]|jgi:hypothetical protein|nr:hypothetical protein [Treponema sp.]